jgi:hypothetical protein
LEVQSVLGAERDKRENVREFGFNGVFLDCKYIPYLGKYFAKPQIQMINPCEMKFFSKKSVISLKE